MTSELPSQREPPFTVPSKYRRDKGQGPGCSSHQPLPTSGGVTPPSLLYLEGSLPTPQCHDHRHSPPGPPTPPLGGRAAAPGSERGAHGLSPKKGKTLPSPKQPPAVIPAQPGSLRSPRSGQASASILINLSKMKNSNRLFFPPISSPSLLPPCPVFADRQMRKTGRGGAATGWGGSGCAGTPGACPPVPPALITGTFLP